jgi:Ca2+-binding RTX toxin-like protein
VSGHGQADAQTAIYLNATDANSLTANAYNNVIWDVGADSATSTSGGFFLGARDSGDADFNIVGNTISTTHDGIKVNNEQDAPNHLSLDVFDNIIQGTKGSAVVLTSDQDGPYIVRGGYNDFWQNGTPNQTDGQSLGTTNVSVRPRFVDRSTGNLALKPSSPLIDKGLACTHGGVAGPDAAGMNRLAGPTVDIGAYESNAGPPGVVLIGTSGPDVLIGGPNNDILCGYAGNDTLAGLEGDDLLDGDQGNDKLYGDLGNDQLFGRKGNDLLCARDGTGGDHLDGGKGIDSFRADRGDVRISVEQRGDCVV